MSVDRMGERIKLKRKSLGLQVKVLSELINVTPSLISQIERAKAYPSIVTLKKLAEALNTTVGELIGENETLTQYPIVNPNNRKFVRKNKKGTALYLLSHHDSQKQMEPYMVIFEKNSDSKEIMTSNLPCQEFCFVLEGTFEILTNNKKHQLNEGDSFYFNSIQEHLFKNISDGIAKLLWVVKLN